MNDLQRTPEWYADRCGCLTASAAAPLFAMRKDGKPTVAYYDLLDRLIAERVSGEVQGSYFKAAMQWGIDHEDDARVAYEAATFNDVQLVGFVHHPEVPFLGASPDGLIGHDGLLEIKCPNTTTHLRRIKEGIVPPEYIPQMIVQCLCTGRQWVDYVDFDPRCRGRFEHLAYWSIRFTPTQEQLDDALKRCVDFLVLVEQTLEDLTGRET